MDIHELCINCFKPTGGEEVCMNCGYIQSDKPRQSCHLYPHTLLNNRYLIGKVINNGGFGVVYKAFDLNLNCIVAIKELLPTQNSMVNRLPGTLEVIPVNEERGASFQKLKMRFLNEASELMNFGNVGGIVHVSNAFQENNTAYMVMEYLEGRTLREIIETNPNGRIDFNEAMNVVMPIMTALKTIHASNIIHCDVSPDNIFICKNGKVKLIDFGAAKFLNSNEIESESNYSFITKPGYTPPEQYSSNGNIGEYTDVYSLGAVLYKILSGVTPDESIDRLEHDKLKRLSDLGVQLPLYAETAIMKALAPRESARFSTMDDFIQAITGEKKSDFPEVELKKRIMRRTISLILIFTVMIGSVVGVFLYKNSRSLVPLKSTEIVLWYRDTGDEELNSRWDNIKKGFESYSEVQRGESKVTLKIEAIPDDKYDSKLEEAFKKGEGPDIFESGTYTNKENIASLKKLYNNLDEKDFDKSSFSKMKDTFENENKIALSFDMPVLYTDTGFKHTKKPSNTSSVFDLKKNKDERYKYSLTCGGNAVYYAYCAYGKDEKVFKDLYSSASLENGASPRDLFCENRKNVFNSMYYIGMFSDYKYISDKSYAGKSSFDVQRLTGSEVSDYYVFPEVYSVSSKSSDLNQKASRFLLYYLIADESGVNSVIRSENRLYYLSMLNASKDKICCDEYVKKLYDESDRKITTFSFDEYAKSRENSKSVSDAAEKGTSFNKMKKSLS